ncbi:MAG: hypothetical protein H7177_09425 [Rhizobacter sp.]|nr:hypothetical protein [Bacteriovorax sp.]
MRNLLLAIMILTPISSFAIVNEISGDFGYDRTIYGDKRQNSNVTRTYSAGLSTYFWDYTALDLNASRTKDVTTENQTYIITSGFNLIGQQNRVTTDVYSIGIKQSFAPRSARLIPSISVGYARQFTESSQDLVIQNTTTNTQFTNTDTTPKQKVNSVYGTFALQLKLTDGLSLKGSIKTLFPAFKFNQAKDTLKYAFGFSWAF